MHTRWVSWGAIALVVVLVPAGSMSLASTGTASMSAAACRACTCVDAAWPGADHHALCCGLGPVTESTVCACALAPAPAPAPAPPPAPPPAPAPDPSVWCARRQATAADVACSPNLGPPVRDQHTASLTSAPTEHASVMRVTAMVNADPTGTTTCFFIANSTASTACATSGPSTASSTCGAAGRGRGAAQGEYCVFHCRRAGVPFKAHCITWLQANRLPRASFPQPPHIHTILEQQHHYPGCPVVDATGCRVL